MRHIRTLTSLSAALCAAASLAHAPPAAAQEATAGIALNRFDPAPAGDRLFSVPSPFSAGHLTPHVMIVGDYAHDPLVLYRERDKERVGAVVAGQLFLHLNASLSLWNRLTINFGAPFAVLQTGESPSGGGLNYSSPTSAQFGDLRLGLRVRLYGEYHDAFQIGLGGYVWLPTGAEGGFVSDGSVRAMPMALVGGHTDRLVYSFSAGAEIRPEGRSFAGVDQGSMVKLGGGLGVLLGAERRLQIGPEVNAALVVSDVSGRTTNIEALAGARYRVIDDLELGLAIGPGLTGGLGTPVFRGLAMIAYTPDQKKVEPAPPPPPPSDRDKDGIADLQDACPEVPGVLDPINPKKNGCPPDKDGDGVVDAQDACIEIAGVASEDPKKNGCPPDKDGDGIVDAQDACVEITGVASEDPKKNGCPDKDGDGVVDAEDACVDVKGVASANPAFNGCPVDLDGDAIANDEDRCPREKGVADPKNPENNGCPKAVRVTEGEIVILQQVQFDTAKATIKRVSDALLDEVAGVLKEHPEILKVEIQGHTDDRGVKASNQKLSQDRAESVRKALVTRGVVATRLEAKGYGQDQPIADNKTEAGRAKNRRVQFKILEKQKKAE